MNDHHNGFDDQLPPAEHPAESGFEAAPDLNPTEDWSANINTTFEWNGSSDTYHPFLDFQGDAWPHLSVPDNSSFGQGFPTSTETDTSQQFANTFNNMGPVPTAPAYEQPLTNPNFNNVAEWLDGAYSPPKPCTYCRRHRLQCLIIRTAPANPNPVTACSSCVALFRECSLAIGEKRQASRFETMSPVFGNLHGVAEDGDVEGTSQQPQTVECKHEERKESKQFLRRGARTLRDWFYQHQEYPYPTEEQKAYLAQETGFSIKRVSTWFANARRRQKQKLQSSGPPVQLFRSGSPMPSMTPMERWQASPPEDEGVPEAAIQNAIAGSGPRLGISSSSNDMNEFDYLFNLDDDSSHLESSVPSVGSRKSEASSDSVSSAWSHNSSGEGGLPFPSLPKRTRPRHRRGRQSRTIDGPYQCTFCTQSFHKKHDWCRHEKSVHISLQSWICTPNLQSLQPLAPAVVECRFCDDKYPSQSHWENHEFHICAYRPVEERSFSRKDYLWQHLKKFHGCTKPPVAQLEAWRSEGNEITSRCGFCQASLSTWSARMHHLAGHFKKGSRMSQWVGDWGLEPSVVAVLRNAVLPAEREPQIGLQIESDAVS